jgi:putative phage-type endonuclease
VKIIDCEQGTAEWKALRAGKVTASRICDVMAKIKTGEAKTRLDYKIQILSEMLTGVPQEDGYVNAAMQWGSEQEPFARAAYEIREGVMVDQVGFVQHPTIDQAGCSPDGLVGDDGLVEIKAPKSSTHLQYLLAGKVPAEYVPQMCWQLACTGREWCDFVSYDPRMPEHLQLFVVRFASDPSYTALVEQEVRRFLAEVNGLLIELGHAEVIAQ